MREFSHSFISEKTRRQSPLLGLAVFLTLGIAAGETFDWNPNLPYFYIASILSAAFCATAMIFERRVFAKFSFFAFVFFAGATYCIKSAPPDPYPHWATRTANLKLDICRSDKNAKGSHFGIAKIISASDYFKDAENTRVWFYAPPTNSVSRGDEIDGVFTVRKVVGEDGFESHLLSQKIFFTASAVETETKRGGFPYTLYNAARAYISRKISAFANEDFGSSVGARAYRAMILGDKSELSKEAKADFSNTGTMHIFAISGLHVGLIAASIFALLSLLRIPRKIRPIICLPMLFLYVNACGARPSAMRAFMMIAFVWAAVAFLRKPKPFAGFVAAYCLSLLMRPTDLFDAGFSLSYGVVAAILLYAVPFYENINDAFNRPNFADSKFDSMRRKAVGYLFAAFAISFAAICASAPLSAAYFGYVAPLAIPFSIVYVAAASIVVSLGLAAVILPEFIAQFANFAAAHIASLMVDGAALGAKTGILIDVKISGTSAFLIESAIVCVLLLGHKIESPAKWALLPAVSAVGIFAAALIA